MAGLLRRPLSLALGLVATTTLGGCYYGDMTSAGYGGGYACSADYYDYDPYAYAEGFGYDCYDSSDYRTEERRLGKKCVGTCKSRWAPFHSKKKKKQQQTAHY